MKFANFITDLFYQVKYDFKNLLFESSRVESSQVIGESSRIESNGTFGKYVSSRV